MEKGKDFSQRRGGKRLELKAGTGLVTAMFPHKDYMEVYKSDYTFRLRSPEQLDSEEKSPDVPWVISEVSGIGSANQIVARTTIQSFEILKDKKFKSDIETKHVLYLMYESKEDLLVCEGIFKKLQLEYEEIRGKVERGELRTENGILNYFPQISELTPNATLF